MPNVMKCISHCTLEGSTDIFETEREVLIGKSSPWTNKSGLVLISGSNIDMVISRKTVHKRVHFASDTLVNNLINEWCGEIILRTGSINIMIIDTNTDGPLFFSHRHVVGDPICEWDRINKTGFKKLLYFGLNSCSLSGVYSA